MQETLSHAGAAYSIELMPASVLTSSRLLCVSCSAAASAWLAALAASREARQFTSATRLQQVRCNTGKWQYEVKDVALPAACAQRLAANALITLKSCVDGWKQVAHLQHNKPLLPIAAVKPSILTPAQSERLRCLGRCTVAAAAVPSLAC